MTGVAGRLSRLGLSKSLGRNSGGVLANQLVLLFTGLFTFWALGARLGVDGYGLYASAVAISHVVGPFGQLGSNHLAVRSYSRVNSLEPGWHAFLGTTLIGGILTTALVVALQPVVAPGLTRTTAALISFSEVVFYGTIGASGLLTETVKRAAVGARIRIGAAVGRFATIGAFLTLDSMSVGQWAWFHLAGQGLGAAYGIAVLSSSLGVRPGLALIDRDDIRLGVGYALNQLASSLQTDVDKIILGYYGFTTALGAYAAGYRLAIFAGLPLTALVGGTYARFFELGQRHVGEARRFAVQLTRLALLLTIPIGLVLAVAAPLVTEIFDEGFSDTVSILRWLAVLPTLKALQIFAANALTGADLHRLRLLAIAGTGGVNVALNLWLIPSHSWRGAVAATIVAETLLAVTLWIALRRAADQAVSIEHSAVAGSDGDRPLR